MTRAAPFFILITSSLFATLEERVKTLEETISQHETRLAATENAKRHDPTAIDNWPELADRPVSIVSSDTAISVNLQDTQEQHNESGTTDGMAMALVDEDECGFFGEKRSMVTLP